LGNTVFHIEFKNLSDICKKFNRLGERMWPRAFVSSLALYAIAVGLSFSGVQAQAKTQAQTQAPGQSKALLKTPLDFISDKYDAPERVLQFPATQTLGTIVVAKDWRNRGRFKTSQLIQARGPVVVPKNNFITFQANQEFFRNPKQIRLFAPNSFDAIQLKLMSMDDSEDELCDQALANITHLKGIRVVLLDKSEVTDAGMKHLAELPNLEYISAFLTPLRGSFFKDLRGLKKLNAMSLESDGLKEEEFKYLPEIENLQILQLSRANVTNKAMKYLAGCKNLRWLDIGKNPRVTDESIPYLKQLKNLQELEVQGTSITVPGLLQLKGLPIRLLTVNDGALSKEQMSALKAALPELKINIRSVGGKVDEETGTIWGQMSRNRRF